MIKNRLFIIVLSLGFLFSSCGAKKKAKNNHVNKRTTKTVKKPKVNTNTSTKVRHISSSTKDVSTEAYITKYANIAVEQMKEHKIPASIILAQGILESRSGNSDLTKVSNNHFGIKCHKKWEGARTFYDDDEKGECFRVYNNSMNSFDDHSRFLVDRKRYAKLFKLRQGDYKGWAKGLRKAGYATDKKYPEKLISIIEKYELYKYDEKVLGVSDAADSGIYIVQQGDGLYGIARKFNMKLSDLMNYNNLTDSNIYPGQKLYLKRPPHQVVNTIEQLKKDTDTVPPIKIIEKTTTEVKEVKTDPVVETISQATPDFHIVQQGENLYQIAYKYKLAVPDLRRWNGIKKNEIRIGQRLWIKDPKLVAPSQNSGDTHTVAPEETLYSISKMYHLSVPELMRLNNLSNYTIYIGQVLRVK